jgi:hypothetical protein
MNNTTTQVEPWQKIIAGLAGVVAAVALVVSLTTHERSELWKLFLPLIGLVASAFIIHRPTLGAQLLARAIWWANLGLASILCFVGGGSNDILAGGAAMAIACGTALLVIGRKGLAEASERANYAPPAFRSSLLLLMVLGLADAQTFLLFGILDATDHVPKLRVFFPVGIAYLVGFVGLYRLATWGALLNMATSLAMILYLSSGGLPSEGELRNVVYVLCTAQLLASIPLGVGLLMKRPLVTLPPRIRAFAAPAAVLAVIVTDVVVAWHRRYG